MNTLKLMLVSTAVAVLLMLNGCGVDAVKPGQAVALKPDQGIAAVVIDTLDPLDNITFGSPDDSNAPDIVIAGVQPGKTMFVYVVPAATYCVMSFNFGRYRFIAKDLKHGTCFDVIAGKVAYSGNIGPRVYNRQVLTGQTYNWVAFRKQLKQEYPNLSGYPVVTP